MKKIQAFCGQYLVRLSLLLVTASAPLLVQGADTSPDQQLNAFSALAGRAGDAKQGELFFNQKHGGKWSCSSCHNTPPVTQGKHAATAKPIKPLAPAANASAFTDTAKIEKWFKRNCKDVLERECTPSEKADVLSYLMGVRP